MHIKDFSVNSSKNVSFSGSTVVLSTLMDIRYEVFLLLLLLLGIVNGI